MYLRIRIGIVVKGYISEKERSIKSEI